MNILNSIDLITAKKIFSSSDNIENYLIEFDKVKGLNLTFRTLTRGKDKGKGVLDMDNDALWNKVISSWNYR